MILPDKHLRIEDSLMIVGARLLPIIRDERRVFDVWEAAKRKGVVRNLGQFYNALTVLYAMSAVELVGDSLEAVQRD